jgi:hypothetical protein
MVQKKDLEIMKSFKEDVSKKIPLKKLILFGSRAKGKLHKWSDFDILLVSNKFRKINSFKRCSVLYDYWHYDYPVDFLCYTPEEFNKLKNKITIVKEAVSNGIVIK